MHNWYQDQFEIGMLNQKLSVYIIQFNNPKSGYSLKVSKEKDELPLFLHLS
jgi:hypothetical protein